MSPHEKESKELEQREERRQKANVPHKPGRHYLQGPGSAVEKALAFNPVTKPRHYNLGKVECIDAIEAAVEGLSGIEAHCTGTALKYLWRHDAKNGNEDLEKAKWYIDRLLKARKARGAK